MQDLVIQPQEGKKGRSFQATCVAVVTANGLFEEANGKTIRPVWAMFAGSDNELRPFVANLRLGRKAEPSSSYRRQGDGERLEFLKTVGYGVAWQRETEGSLATLYHPELFRLDPGMVDPEGVRFVMLVPSDWCAQQKVDCEGPATYVQSFSGCPLSFEELRALVPTAYLFAAYLDRRTRCPLIADGRFYLQLLCGALDRKLASFPGTDVKYNYGHRDDWGHNQNHGFNIVIGGLSVFRGPSIEAINCRHAISFSAKHDELEAFLAEQVTLYFNRTDGEFISLGQRIDLSGLEA